MWRVLKLEVLETIGSVVHKLLYDKSVDRATRIERARALRVLGLTMMMTASAPLQREWSVDLPVGSCVAVERHAETGAVQVAAEAMVEAVGDEGVESAANGADEGADRAGEGRRLLPGDTIVAIRGAAVVGYAHALETAPDLLSDHFGDVSRGIARAVGSHWAGAVASTPEDEWFLREADKAGPLGRGTMHSALQHVLHDWRREWTVQWVCLRGDRLACYSSKEGGARGKVELRGAHIDTDDFGSHQAFTITISRYDDKGSKPIYLSATSLRERLAWTMALERAAGMRA